MSIVKNVFESRRSAQEELKSLYSAAEGRALTADEKVKEQRLAATITDLQNREANLHAMEVRDAEARDARLGAEGRGLTGGRLGASGNEVRQFAEATLEALQSGHARAAAEVQAEFRDLLAGTATKGAEAVPTLTGSLAEVLVQDSPIFRHVNILQTASGADLWECQPDLAPL